MFFGLRVEGSGCWDGPCCLFRTSNEICSVRMANDSIFHSKSDSPGYTGDCLKTPEAWLGLKTMVLWGLMSLIKKLQIWCEN